MLTKLLASLATVVVSLTVALTLAPSAQAANGCGPADWRARFVPNSPLGFPFRSACDWHDRCYGTPWYRVAYSYAGAKDSCDRWFYYKMAETCGRTGGTTDFRWCMYLAYGYYRAVSEHGSGAYRSAQRR